jgi:hypothetical protein
MISCQKPEISPEQIFNGESKEALNLVHIRDEIFVQC